jgi:hypothetical protein
MDDQNLRSWLVREIRGVLDRKTGAPPLLLWLDPDSQWLDLLRAAAKTDGFDLWADPAQHELLVRDRFCRTPRAPRVVWLPCKREDITWFKPFELEAEAVWEKTLLEAIREFGIYIPREHEVDLACELSAYAREWFDQPKDAWAELTPGNARGALIDDARMLQVLAGETGEFERLRTDGRFDFFANRAVKDLGLPDPTGKAEDLWRLAATARLLATEAAEGCPQDPPRENDKIIPPGLARRRALGLLKNWQSNIHFIPTFERLVPEADRTLGLAYWARNVASPPRSFSSRLVEETLFSLAAERLDRMEQVDLLTKELVRGLQTYQDRQQGFWERQATEAIGWRFLVRLAGVANLLVEFEGVDSQWKMVADAVAWYTSRGWQLDWAGEQLFQEEPGFPSQLQRVRTRLRRGYLRAVDRIGGTFSELLSADSSGVASMPTAGEAVLAEVQRQKGPLALVFLDACRFDLGRRLADMLNTGEPALRATVSAAVAPVPSITDLGMALALPMPRSQLRVRLTPNGKFAVTAEGFDGNLSLAADRRDWLKKCWEVKECLDIEEVLDGETLKPATKARRLIAVYGKELDQHDGQLQLTGADDHLKRYVLAIRRLRDAGYSRVIVVTDHGFFHWQPEEHEIEIQKPTGDLLWESRRAMVGRGLSHPHAVKLPVPCSDYEAMIPRSVNAFRTYGGLGFFHGGATLQELVIPVVVATWPAKANKVEVVLKPVGHIASESPRVQVQAGVSAASKGRLFATDTKQLSRRVLVKVRDPSTGSLVFRHAEAVTVEPNGEPITVNLTLVDPRPVLAYDTPLLVQVLDADNEELLAHEDIALKVDLNEW